MGSDNPDYSIAQETILVELHKNAANPLGDQWILLVPPHTSMVLLC